MKVREILRCRAEAAAFFALIGLFRICGLESASAIGAFIGRQVLYRSPLSIRARANLRTAYPRLPDDEIEAIVREMWENLGRTIAEYAHLEKLSVHGPDARIRVDGFEHVEAARASGRPIIFISGHFGNWEVLAFAAQQSGIEGGAVYRPINNPYIDSWLVRQRMTNGPKEQIEKGPRGTRRIFTLLRARKVVFLLADQKTNEGMAVPFFGRDAMTTPAPAALALKMDAVLLPVSNERTSGSRFRVTVHPPIPFQPGHDHDSDVYALTRKINDTIEAMVRARPSQWLWIHRRWPRPGDRPRSRRGQAAQALAGAGVRVDSDGSRAT